jgi:hypothetical protein
MLFDELFVGMAADRVAPRTLKLARKTPVDANGIPLAVSPPPGSGSTSSTASPSQSPPHTSPLHGARSILDAPAIPPSAFLLDRPPSIERPSTASSNAPNSNTNSNGSNTPQTIGSTGGSNRMTKKEEAEHRRLTKLRKDLDKLGLDVIASPVSTTSTSVSSSSSSAATAGGTATLHHSSSSPHMVGLPSIPPYSSSTLDFGPRATTAVLSSMSSVSSVSHSSHNDDLGWEPADHDLVEDSFTLEDEGSSSDSEPMRHILSEVAAQNLLGRSRHDPLSTQLAPVGMAAATTTMSTTDANILYQRQRSGSGAGLTPTLLNQAQWPTPVSLGVTTTPGATVATTANSTVASSSRSQRPQSAPPSATGFRNGTGSGMSASPQQGSGVSSPVVFEGSDRSRQLVATHSRSSSIPDGTTLLTHHGASVHVHGHIHHTQTGVHHHHHHPQQHHPQHSHHHHHHTFGGSSGMHGNITPTPSTPNGAMLPSSSPPSQPISPSHVPHNSASTPSSQQSPTAANIGLVGNGSLIVNGNNTVMSGANGNNVGVVLHQRSHQ